MRFSIISFGKGWLQVIDRLASRTTWRDDLRRGIVVLTTGGASIADRGLAEMELRQLRGRLQQVEEKLTQAYQGLGKKSMDHWAGQQILDPKEQNRALHGIDALEKEKGKLIGQIAAHKTPTKGNPPSQPS